MTQQDFASSQSGSLSPGNPQVYLTYIPKPGLGWLSIKNFVLTVVTIGIYSFWGKTNVRRHLWSCVRIMDEPLEYTGTGKELFLGMLVVLGIVILPILIIQNAIPFLFPGDLVLQFSVQFAVFVVILYLLGVAVYRARRYRLSRTIWRGIRGTLTGSPWAYAWKSFWMTLILPFTLLWSYPWMRVRLNSHIMNDTQFGSESFRFDGRAGPLYKRFAILWVLMLVAMLVIGVLSALPGLNIGSAVSDAETQISAETLGIAALLGVLVFLPLLALLTAIFWAIYVSTELNYFARCTAFENSAFSMNATTWSLIGLAIGNFLILVFTLGIAAPFVQQRLIRYLCDRTTINGTIDVAAIQQSQAEMDKRGEGLAEAFDVDAF